MSTYHNTCFICKKYERTVGIVSRPKGDVLLCRKCTKDYVKSMGSWSLTVSSMRKLMDLMWYAENFGQFVRITGCELSRVPDF